MEIEEGEKGDRGKDDSQILDVMMGGWWLG